MKKPLILLTLAAGLCYGGECKGQPDVCMWNEAMQATKVFADAETEYSIKAAAFVKARQDELNAPGSISVDRVRAATAMWIAWQNYLAAQKVMNKAMHDFWVVEMNQ